jgi:hypothetical protein
LGFGLALRTVKARRTPTIRLKARLRPMRGLTRCRSAEVLAAGHAFVQNLRRGHYELATDASAQFRLRTALTELALAM